MANVYTNYKANLSTTALTTTGNMDQGSSDSAIGSPTPIVFKESEILKAQAQNGGDLTVIVSVLEIT